MTQQQSARAENSGMSAEDEAHLYSLLTTCVSSTLNAAYSFHLDSSARVMDLSHVEEMERDIQEYVNNLLAAKQAEIDALKRNQITPEMRETYAALMASDMKALTRLLPAFLEAFRVGMGGGK